MDAIKPLLTTHDWNEEWKDLQTLRRRADDAAYWDKRASSFSTKDAPNAYVEKFLQLADLHPEESVLDMGCGTGALSLPLAMKNHPVIAADFSQGMLDVLHEEAQQKQITSITSKLMSWDDNWLQQGICDNCVDVAFASRSIATSNLRDALLKLTNTARRRVCITLSTGSSPRVDENILNAIGLKQVLGRDYLYAFNILVSENLKPEVSYIESYRTDTFDSPEEAYEVFSRMVEDAGILVPQEERSVALDQLHYWVADNIVPNENVGLVDCKGLPEKAYRLRTTRKVTWAFLAWNR